MQNAKIQWFFRLNKNLNVAENQAEPSWTRHFLGHFVLGRSPPLHWPRVLRTEKNSAFIRGSAPSDTSLVRFSNLPAGRQGRNSRFVVTPRSNFLEDGLCSLGLSFDVQVCPVKAKQLWGRCLIIRLYQIIREKGKGFSSPKKKLSLQD
jgi:hypothetical protein